VAPNREDVLSRVAAARTKTGQALRYRLAMLERRLRQQGIDRALSLLHRRLGRSLQSVDEREYRLREWMRATLDARERTRRMLQLRLERFDARPRLALGRRRMERAGGQAIETVRRQLAQRRSRFEQLTAHLSQLSPLRILERGYAIVSRQGEIVKDAAAAPKGSSVHVRLAKGGLDAVVAESSGA
jgi:exodeoxyribonuclease VII large subunit